MQLYLPLSKNFCRNPAQSIKCSDLQSDFSLLDSSGCLRFWLDTEHSRNHKSQKPHVSTSKKKSRSGTVLWHRNQHNTAFMHTTKPLPPDIGQFHADNLLGMLQQTQTLELCLRDSSCLLGHHHTRDTPTQGTLQRMTSAVL